MNNQTSTSYVTTSELNPRLSRALGWAGNAAKYTGIRGQFVGQGLRAASKYLETNDVREAPAAIAAAAKKHPVKAALGALAGLYLLRRLGRR